MARRLGGVVGLSLMAVLLLVSLFGSVAVVVVAQTNAEQQQQQQQQTGDPKGISMEHKTSAR